MTRKVKVLYFKPTGKWSYEGEYEAVLPDYDLVADFEARVEREGHAPGLSSKAEHYIKVLLPIGDWGYPFLIPAKTPWGG